MSRVPPIGLRISSRTQDAPFLGTSQHYYYDQFKHHFLLNRIIRKLRMLKLFSLPTSGGKKGSAKLSGALTHVVLQPELLPLSTLLKAKQYFSFQLLQSKSFFKTKALPAFGSRFILLAGSNSNRMPHDDDATRRSRQHICCYYFTEQNQNGELQFLPPKKNEVFFTDGKRNCQGCETNDEVEVSQTVGLKKSEAFLNSAGFHDGKKKNQHKTSYPNNARTSISTLHIRDEVRPRLEKALFFLSNFELGRKSKAFFEDKNRLEYTPAFNGEIKKKAIKDPKAFFRTRTSNSLKASLFCAVGSPRNKNTKSFSEKEKAGETLPSSTKNDDEKISFELLKNLCLRPFFTGKNVMQSKKNSNIHQHGVSHWSKNFQDTNAQQLPHPESAHHQHYSYRGTENATVVLASIISLNKHKFRCKLWSTQLDQQLSQIAQCKKDKNKRVTRPIGDGRCTATTNNLSKNHSSESAIPPLMVVPCRDQGDRPHSPGTAQVNSGADTPPTIDRGCFASQSEGTHPRFVTQSCSFLKHINILGTAYAQNDVRSVKKTTFFSPVKNKKGSPRIAVQSIFLLACLQQLSNSTNPLMHLLSTHFVMYNKDHTCYVRKNRVFSSGCGEATTTAISNLTFFPLPNSQVLKITNSLVLNRWCPKDAICAETNKRISRATTIITIDDSEQLLPLMESTFLINSRYIQYANEDLPRIKTNRKVKGKKKNYSFEKWQKQLRNADEQTFKSFNSSGEALPRLLLHRAFASPTELHMFALAECALASSKFNPFQNRSFFVRPWKGCLTLCKHETPFQMSISTQARVDAKLKKYKNAYFRHKSRQAYRAYPEAYFWDVRKSLAKSKLEERKKKSFLFFFGIFASVSPSQAFFLRKLFFFAKLEERRKKRASLFLNWNSKAQTQLFSKPIALSSEKQSFFFARFFSSPFLRKQISLFHQKMSFFPMPVLIMHKLLVSDQSLRYVAQRKNCVFFSHLTSRFCPASLGLCRIKAGVLFDLVYPSQIVKQYDQWLKNEKKHSFLTHTLKNSKSIVLKNFISIRL